jgi:two-component sensor histidine kinase
MMSTSGRIEVAPVVPPEGEDALLLREYGHRAMNDFAVARSAVAIAMHAVRGSGEPRLLAALGEAGARLDGIGGMLRLLAEPARARVDLGSRLVDLCRAACAARPDAALASLELDVRELWVDGATARRVSLIAAELVANACRHGLAGRAGMLRISLRRAGRDVVLQVSSDVYGAAPASTAGTGLGGGIVAGLARLGDGTVTLQAQPRGALATLRMPLAPVPAMTHAR